MQCILQSLRQSHWVEVIALKSFCLFQNQKTKGGMAARLTLGRLTLGRLILGRPTLARPTCTILNLQQFNNSGRAQKPSSASPTQLTANTEPAIAATDIKVAIALTDRMTKSLV
jgi:hypothetical protein